MDTHSQTEPAISDFLFSHATRQVVFGAGSFQKLSAYGHDAPRVFVVLDAFFENHILRQQLSEIFEDAVFHAVPEGEPTSHSVIETTRKLESVCPDLVIALGGGSTIDTAKAALAFASNPGDFKSLFWPNSQIVHAHPATFIAIPTTAGSGSEVSETAVIDQPGTVYKSHMRSPYIAARIVILDPELTLSTPFATTASSGFDALTHAIEAYTSRGANPMTDPLALSGATLLIQNLVKAAMTPDDIAARGACLLGSAQAGIAFNSAHLGLSHAIAGALGALHHVPHGLANALALPWTMAFNRSACRAKDAVLAEVFDAPNTAAGLSKLRFDLKLDVSIDDFVTGADKLDAVAEAAMTSGQIAMNPRTPNVRDIRAILEAMRHETGGGDPQLNL